MAPTDLAGLVVNGLDYTRAPNLVVRAGPTVDSIGRLSEVKAPTGMGVDNKQTVLAVVARRTVVGHAPLVGCNEASIGGGLLGGVWNRTTLIIDSKRPIHRPERNGQEILPIGAVENKEVAVARSLHEHLLRFTVEISVNQNRSLHRIPVVGVVRRHLERPHKFAGIRI